MAREKSSSFWPTVTIIIAVLCLLVSLPDSLKRFAPGFLKPGLNLGLDLAGGTQLDFRISEDEIKERKAQVAAEIEQLKGSGNAKDLEAKQFELRNIEEQHKNLVEAIRMVLERRINSLGVSEATITPSFFGSEKHLLVECPGIIDVDRCIATIGKTIRLEFKEEYSGDTGAYAIEMRKKADAVYRAITVGTGSMQVYGQDLSNQLGVSYVDAEPVFLSSLPKGLEALASRTSKDPVLKTESTIQTTAQNADGQMELKEIRGIYLTKILEDKKPVSRPLTDPSEAFAELAKKLPGTLESKQGVDINLLPETLRVPVESMQIGAIQGIILGTTGESALFSLLGKTDGTEQMTASHILIQFKGADRVDATVTRSKEQAKTLAESIKKRLNAGESFTTIARTESDGPSKEKAGSLGVITRNMGLAPSFEAVAFTLKQGQVSDVVESSFGFHIIRADLSATTSAAKISYELLTFKGDQAKIDELLSQIEKGLVMKDDQQIVVRNLFFSLEPTGWKDTPLNGQRFRSASVSFDDRSAQPLVQIQFDEEGGKLFEELTKNNIGKRIAIFVGGELVSAPTVQGVISGGNAVITGSRNIQEAQTLAQDLNTGAIPAPIYLTGQSTVEATLGTNALQQSVVAAGVGLMILCLALILIYRVFGIVASIALLLYVVLLVASMKLPLLLITKERVVLTLAGIAGMILSMGMAVDANVLAFERVKEELRRGKLLKTAVETGFKKAWPSVRDGNVSTLITCAILFVVGTSIIRGFAVTLSIGIFISLFTGMVVSKWICMKIANSPLANRPELFGVQKGKNGGSSGI